MEPTAILNLFKDAGPWGLAVMGWVLFFRRDQRVTALEDWRAALVEKLLSVTQRVNDINHVAMAIAAGRDDRHAEESSNG
jgi:hypothetical protein